MKKETTAKTTTTKKNSAFNKPVNVSPELAAVIGHGPMPRTEVTKKLWDYIKKHKLQSNQNKRNIVPDDKLAKVFGSHHEIDMFKMAGKVSTHLKEAQLAGAR